MVSPWVYDFSSKQAQLLTKEQLGGKGLSLVTMNKLGVDVPHGFTIITDACRQYYASTGGREEVKRRILKEVVVALRGIESKSGRKFGGTSNPLLLSVRSGAATSMPGMMDTVLNLGLNKQIVDHLLESGADPVFVMDNYRRFIQMYGSVVLSIDGGVFENIISYHKEKNQIESDQELDLQTIRQIVEDFNKSIVLYKNAEIPEDPLEQLYSAIEAVFRSWDNERAVSYREMYGISHDGYTAVNVQSMVFGNLNGNSCTGVVFSRNPNDGSKYVFGEFLPQAQGEDVVSGVRDTYPINISTKSYQGSDSVSMEELFPSQYRALEEVCTKLEKYNSDVQDIEFTVEDGKLWILQYRNAKRSIVASLNIARDMVIEGVMTEEQAILSIDSEDIDKLSHKKISDEAEYSILAKGLAASPGAAVGHIALDSDQAKNMHQQQLPVILIRPETSPDDISGINASVGIVTARGGMTSHAAVVARGMGKPCICSVSGLTIDEDQQCLFIGGERLVKGDIITIDGTAGSVINDSVPVISSTPPASFDNIMDIVSKLQALEVRANAETSNDIEYALKSGARGIGLCRTEHMFFERDRILDIRKMLLSKDHKKVDRAIQSMLTYQQEDFIKIFSLTKELPVTIRLLDMPLHEFLPKNDKEIEDYCDYMQESVESVRNNISSRYEHNPMLGYRGCRVAVINPAIYEMQISAIFTAVIHLKEKHGMTIEPEIMLPLVMHQNEVMLCTQMIKFREGISNTSIFLFHK